MIDKFIKLAILQIELFFNLFFCELICELYIRLIVHFGKLNIDQFTYSH